MLYIQLDFYCFLYETTMKINRTLQATVHTSFLLSQSCKLVLEYVLSIFPPDFFKRTYVSTQDRNIETIKRLLNGIDATEGEFAKAVPAIAIHPNFTLDGTVRENPKFNDWFDIGMNPGLNTVYSPAFTVPIYEDYSGGRFIRSLPKEIKLTFTIFIRAETVMQSWDIMNYIKNRFIFDQFRFLNNIHFMGQIPNVIMHNLSISYGLDFNKKEDRAELNRKFMLWSLGRSGREVQDYSKGHSIYAIDYLANPLIKFQLPSDNKNKKNNVVSDVEVQFEGEFQVKHFTNFNLEIFDVNDDVGFVEKSEEGSISAQISFEKKLIPLPNFLNEGEWQVCFKKGFETEPRVFDGNKEVVEEAKEYLNPQFNFSTANYIQKGNYELPFGWKINSKGSILLETSKETDSDDKNCLKVSHELGQYELATIQPIDVVPESSYKMLITYTADIRNFNYVVGIHPIGPNVTRIPFRKRFHNTYPERKQTAEILFNTTASKIGITIRPETFQTKNNIVLHNISLKKVNYVPLRGDRFDTLELKGILPKDLEVVIKENNRLHQDNNEVFKILMIEYGEDKYYEDFEIDWNKLRITMKNPRFGRIYYLNLYAKVALYNSLVKLYQRRFPFLVDLMKIKFDNVHME